METGFTHDPYYHLKIFKQALSIEKKPLSFLLAAGCPLGVEMTAPKVWPLIPAIKELTVFINDQLKKDTKISANYIKLLEEIGKASKNIENVEDILSFVRSLKEVASGGEVRGFSHDDLVEIDNKVCETIANKLKVELPDRVTPYHSLANWISSIDRTFPVEIFTLNYDLLMEHALEDFAIPYYDGFVGSKNPFFDLKAIEGSLIPLHWTRIWKIHGSINWFKNGDDVNRFSGNNHSGSHLIYPSHLKYDQSRKMPYLALIDRLSTSLKTQPSIMIICGYSFSDDHINNCIVNALKTNPTSIVIALQFGKLSGYEKAIKLAESRPNLSLWAKDEAVIGTRRGLWMPQSNSVEGDSLKRWVKSTTETDSGGKETTSFGLDFGDFKEFGNFLKSLIGEIEDEK